jgi:hypothetical protein
MNWQKRSIEYIWLHTWLLSSIITTLFSQLQYPGIRFVFVDCIGCILLFLMAFVIVYISCQSILDWKPLPVQRLVNESSFIIFAHAVTGIYLFCFLGIGW